MPSPKTVVTYAKKPYVLAIGGGLGLYLLFRKRGGGGGGGGVSDQTLLETRKVDSATAIELAKVSGMTDQTRIDAENRLAISAVGFNAGITSKAIESQTLLALAGEETKQMLGTASILAHRDITVNRDVMTRDTTLGLDYNSKSLQLGLDTNRMMQTIAISGHETDRFLSLQESNRALFAAQTSQHNAAYAGVLGAIQATNQPTQRSGGGSFGSTLAGLGQGLGSFAGGLSRLVGVF